jgi:segregation and condensation protein B
MSLKAKIEAVIYAAEEPVTLAQLAAIFTADALELKAEREAAAAAANPEPPAATQPLLDEGFAYLGLEQTPAFYTAPDGEAGGLPVTTPSAPEPQPAAEVADAEAEGAPALSSVPAMEAGVGNVAADETAPAAEAASSTEAESDLKREARLRDRAVRAILQELIEELKAAYASDDRGIEIREIAGGYRMATKPECHDAVRMFIRSLNPPLKLTLQALETLAVVAYKQPVTAPEVSEIRGVESAGTLGSLLSRKLIATAGRKQVIGRPILYKTTREFLLRFGLKDVAELPSMEEFEKMAAIELDEQLGEVNGSEEAVEEAALVDSAESLSEQAGDALTDEVLTDGTAATESVPAESHPEAAEPAEASAAAEPAETEASPHGQ